MSKILTMIMSAVFLAGEIAGAIASTSVMYTVVHGAVALTAYVDMAYAVTTAKNGYAAELLCAIVCMIYAWDLKNVAARLNYEGVQHLISITGFMILAYLTCALFSLIKQRFRTVWSMRKG